MPWARDLKLRLIHVERKTSVLHAIFPSCTLCVALPEWASNHYKIISIQRSSMDSHDSASSTRMKSRGLRTKHLYILILTPKLLAVLPVDSRMASGIYVHPFDDKYNPLFHIQAPQRPPKDFPRYFVEDLLRVNKSMIQWLVSSILLL